MTLNEIKTAVAAGKTVHWSNDYYTVICDKHNQWMIKGANGHCIGLTWADEVTMNGKEEDFYIAKEKFRLIHDRKITIWKRQHYNVSANTIEEAADILRKHVTQEEFNDGAITATKYEYLDDSITVLEPEDNDGNETSCIMADDDIVKSEALWTNAQESQAVEPAPVMPTFFKKDKSGRDGSYEISFDDLIEEEEEEIEENEEFADWLYNAEVGDEYTEFNDRTYTRIK